MILQRRRKRDSFLPWAQLVFDILIIYGLLKFVFWFRFESHYFETGLSYSDYPAYKRLFNLTLVVFIFFLRHYGLYSPARFFTFSSEAGKILKASVVSVMVLMALTFFIRGYTFSRTFLVSAGLVLAIGLSLGRVVLGLFVMAVDKLRGSVRNILIIGCNENAGRLVEYYKKNPRFSARVSGFLDETKSEDYKFHNVPVVGGMKDLKKYLRDHREIHEVVLALPGVASDTVLKIIYECEKEMVAFRWMADIFGILTSKMSVSHLNGVSLLSFTDSPLLEWENRVFKRVMDILFSALGLLILSPLMLIIALLVTSSSKGPIFYKQKRVGQDGRGFNIYKFRTMKKDAEKETGPVWAKEDDPRRTSIGTFLRENNLDELPQLVNVLRGNMSLVGPRPERPHFVSQFKEDIPRYMARHTIRSGITGWAQVNGLRGNTSIEERTKFDLYYLENWSIFLDLKIIFLTVFKLFSSRNAY